MPPIIAIIKESFGALTALALGIRCYKLMNTFWRLIFLQLIVYILMVILGYIVTSYQKNHGLERNNVWVYNISMVLEVIFLLLAARQIIKINKKLPTILFFVFLAAFVLNVDEKGLFTFAQYAYVAAGICVVATYFFLLHSSFNSLTAIEVKGPFICLYSGLIIYFACIIPYFSLINYLTENYPQMSKLLFHIITDVLANLRYLLLALAFFLIRRNAVLNQKTTHGY